MWGAFANLIPTLPDFAGEGLRSLTGGATAKERKNYITDTRKLRKHQYQDMVYSLTKAGLNPILAVGASPGGTGGATSSNWAGSGHSAGVASAAAAQSGASAAHSAANAAGRQAGVAEQANPARIEEMLSNAGLRRELSGNAVAERANILQRLTLDGAQIDQIRATTEAQKALAALHRQTALEKGASASKLAKETSMYDEYGAPWATWERMLLEMLKPQGNSAKSGSAQIWDDAMRFFDDRANPQNFKDRHFRKAP